jgi:2-haloacid dehalogenase
MIDLDRIKLISFDCYGTLIDWETGILGAVRPILDAHGVSIDDDALLESYGRIESAIEGGAYLPYRNVLAGVVRELGRRMGFEPTGSECASLAESIAGWPAFADTVDALSRLALHAKLAIISNVDDDLFAGSAARLRVDFDCVVTAQQVRSYKPSARNFEFARERFQQGCGIAQPEWLHAAQSLFHDIAPAGALGIQTAWINRRAVRTGHGATPPATATPDLAMPDMRSLADRFEG